MTIARMSKKSSVEEKAEHEKIDGKAQEILEGLEECVSEVVGQVVVPW